MIAIHSVSRILLAIKQKNGTYQRRTIEKSMEFQLSLELRVADTDLDAAFDTLFRDGVCTAQEREALLSHCQSRIMMRMAYHHGNDEDLFY